MLEHDQKLIAATNTLNLAASEATLDSGADIHAHDDFALREAASCGRTDLVEFLLLRGANVLAENSYALRAASKNGHVDTVKLLLKHGAGTQKALQYSLRIGTEKEKIEIVSLLLQAGADMSADGYAAVKTAIASNGRVTLLNEYLDCGLDPQNPILIEAASSYPEVRSLLEQRHLSCNVDQGQGPTSVFRRTGRI